MLELKVRFLPVVTLNVNRRGSESALRCWNHGKYISCGALPAGAEVQHTNRDLLSEKPGYQTG
jgi:hypothetical protein